MTVSLYVSIPKAAKIAGASIAEMSAYANRSDFPIPHKLSENGGKKMIELAAILPWMRKYVTRSSFLPSEYSPEVDIEIVKLIVTDLVKDEK